MKRDGNHAALMLYPPFLPWHMCTTLGFHGHFQGPLVWFWLVISGSWLVPSGTYLDYLAKCDQKVICDCNTSGHTLFSQNQKFFVPLLPADKVWRFRAMHVRLYITQHQGSVVAISLHRLAHPGDCCICDFSRKSHYITTCNSPRSSCAAMYVYAGRPISWWS